MTSTHGRSIARGVGWMLLFKLTERSLGIVSTLVLARVLSPQDFGVVAMAQSVIVMVQLLAMFGFDLALIRDPSASVDHYHTAWTLNAALGALICLIVVGLADPIAAFYSKPELFWVVCALAASSLFSGLENIGIVAFRKEMRFRSEFVFQVSRKLVAIGVTVPLAFALESYWALVAGTVASALASTLISYRVHPFRPRFSLAKAAELFSFSRWLLLGNVIGFVRDRAPDFFIGRFAGAAALGAYNVSYEIANLPTTELSAPINRALMPGYAAVADDRAALQRTYLEAFGLLACLAVPAAVGIVALADLLVPVLLGPKWIATVPLVQMLAAIGVFRVMQSSSAMALVAIGHPKSVSLASGLYAGVLLVCLALLVPSLHAEGAAIATAVATLVATPVFLLQLRRYVGIALRRVAYRVWRPACGAAVMLAAVSAAVPRYAPEMGVVTAIEHLAAGAVLAVIAYAGTVVSLWWMVGRPSGAEQALLAQIRRLLRRRTVSPPRDDRPTRPMPAGQ
ncbi:MAG TPA: lipopolysaccharide biosynthesis protein [Burkholderiaceae bacterium]|nr:lipopolysaccharide biosynthesis protein [Burkholderiaceae bacterium]